MRVSPPLPSQREHIPTSLVHPGTVQERKGKHKDYRLPRQIECGKET